MTKTVRNKDLPDFTYKLAGSVLVKFPLQPYPSQIEIVSKMLSAIKKGENGVFESPTGTGKSLAILLGALSLQDQVSSENAIPNHSGFDEPERTMSLPTLNSDSTLFSSPIKRSTTSLPPLDYGIPSSSPIEKMYDHPTLESDLRLNQPGLGKNWNGNVVISSRTQKQLVQLVKELSQKTNLNPPMAMIASREFYCIHPKRDTWESKDEECIKLRVGVIPTAQELGTVREGEKIHCPFESNSVKLAAQTKFQSELWDIEDLVDAGKAHEACPFYASRSLAKEAKLIFAPYNYILDPRIREACSVSLERSVLVIDEAHNVEQVATEGVSMSISELDLLDAKQDLKRLRSTVYLDARLAASLSKVEELVSFFLAFCHRYKGIEMPSYNEDENHYWAVFDGKDGLRMINRNFKPELPNLHNSWDLITPIEPFTDHNGKPVELVVETKRVIENILLILGLLYEGNWAWCYKLVLGNTHTVEKEQEVVNFSFSWWCLSPKVVFDGIGKAVRSLILTSGTLAPLKEFGPSLGLKFSKKAECLHVIKPFQILARKISHSPSGQQLIGNFRNRDTNDYKDAVGESILRILENSTQGTLVFMPSYSVMHQIFIRWKETGLYKKLEDIRTIFNEPRTKLNDNFMTEYSNSCFDAKPGLLFCVYRGKLSEGIDFANEQARSVICVGIPYPAYVDPLVQEKIQFHQGEWYNIQAYRAINQALGRCIRHSKDWGGVFLLDSRIKTEMLPKWFREYLENDYDWDNLTLKIREFVTLNNRIYCHFCGHGVLVSKITGCVNEHHQFCQACYKKWFDSEFDNIVTMLEERDEGEVGLDCLVSDCPFRLSLDQVEELFKWLDFNTKSSPDNVRSI